MAISSDICSWQAPTIPVWTLCWVLSIPHFLYAILWLRPDVWQNFFGKASLAYIANCGYICKGLQMFCAWSWLASQRPNFLCLDLSEISYFRWILATFLFCFGQSLNVAIYKAIGTKGVYYGYKLGYFIPWRTGFPFNVVDHPQYVGSVMTLWSTYVLFGAQSPPSMLALSIYWTLLYVVTGIKEDRL